MLTSPKKKSTTTLRIVPPRGSVHSVTIFLPDEVVQSAESVENKYSSMFYNSQVVAILHSQQQQRAGEVHHRWVPSRRLTGFSGWNNSKHESLKHCRPQRSTQMLPGSRDLSLTAVNFSSVMAGWHIVALPDAFCGGASPMSVHQFIGFHCLDCSGFLLFFVSMMQSKHCSLEEAHKLFQLYELQIDRGTRWLTKIASNFSRNLISSSRGEHHLSKPCGRSSEDGFCGLTGLTS